MIVWRLARAVYPALDGEGARRHGGCWNAPGTPIAYTSEHLSLAVLETLVHADPDLLPDDLTAYQIEVPDDLARDDLARDDLARDDLAGEAAGTRLPRGWRDPAVSARLGEEWVQTGGAVLVVPSLVVPQERNVLVNPRHPDAGRVRVVGSEPFAFDPRLVAR